MKLKNRHTRQFIVFALVVSIQAVLYEYPEVLFRRPQSIHNWRQCDGASIALCYYQEGMHFFKPQTQGLYSGGYTTGYSSPSEIPILYYLIAALYHLFGYHEFIFRAVNLLLFFIGLFYLFRLASAILNDWFYPAVVVALIFSSPLLVYYANNFMPNTVALSFSFIGWYYFYRFYQNKTTRTFMISMLFFGIAGALKITELCGPIIILCLLTIDKLGLFNLQLDIKSHYWKKVSAIAFIFIVIAGWVFYAKYYNRLHGSTQFSTYTFPIWSMTGEDIRFTLHKMNVLWFKDYFYPATFYFMLACLFVMILLGKRSDKVLLFSSVMLVAGLIVYSLLWFQALGDHDYFYIGFYVLPAFLFVNFFSIIKGQGFSRVLQLITKVIFAAVIAVNVIHARNRNEVRYHSWMNDYPQMKDIYTIQPWLNEIGIGKQDTAVFYPSYNIRPLYLMNLKGWTIFDHDEVNEKIEHRDSILMHTYLKNGAEYFITNRIESAVMYNPFSSYMKDLYAQYGSVYIFRIPPKVVNFDPKVFLTSVNDSLSVDP